MNRQHGNNKHEPKRNKNQQQQQKKNYFSSIDNRNVTRNKEKKTRTTLIKYICKWNSLSASMRALDGQTGTRNSTPLRQKKHNRQTKTCIQSIETANCDSRSSNKTQHTNFAILIVKSRLICAFARATKIDENHFFWDDNKSS